MTTPTLTPDCDVPAFVSAAWTAALDTEDPRGSFMDTLITAIDDDGPDSPAFERFRLADALYWFANHYHGGVHCPLYRGLCTGYSPGICQSGVDPADQDTYEAIADCWFGAREVLRENIMAAAVGDYQRDLLTGRARWSGADLKGKARQYGARYRVSRANLVDRIRAIRGVESATFEGGTRKEGPLRLVVKYYGRTLRFPEVAE